MHISHWFQLKNCARQEERNLVFEKQYIKCTEINVDQTLLLDCVPDKSFTLVRFTFSNIYSSKGMLYKDAVLGREVACVFIRGIDWDNYCKITYKIITYNLNDWKIFCCICCWCCTVLHINIQLGISSIEHCSGLWPFYFNFYLKNRNTDIINFGPFFQLPI